MRLDKSCLIYIRQISLCSRKTEILPCEFGVRGFGRVGQQAQRQLVRRPRGGKIFQAALGGSMEPHPRPREVENWPNRSFNLR